MTSRERVIKISKELGLSHIGSCLTSVDIIDQIYKLKKKDEKFILSAGHAHLAHLIVIHENDETVKDLILKYGIHCDRRAGCDVSTGSLGHGLGIAVGMSLSDRTKNVHCLITDGECSEGSIFESLRIAQEQNLTNLKVYLNANGYGAYKEIDLNRLEKQIEGFGFPVYFIRTNIDEYLELKGLKGHYAKI